MKRKIVIYLLTLLTLAGCSLIGTNNDTLTLEFGSDSLKFEEILNEK